LNQPAKMGRCIFERVSRQIHQNSIFFNMCTKKTKKKYCMGCSIWNQTFFSNLGLFVSDFLDFPGIFQKFEKIFATTQEALILIFRTIRRWFFYIRKSLKNFAFSTIFTFFLRQLDIFCFILETTGKKIVLIAFQPFLPTLLGSPQANVRNF
jgi:hypothetical protein